MYNKRAHQCKIKTVKKRKEKDRHLKMRNGKFENDSRGIQLLDPSNTFTQL